MIRWLLAVMTFAMMAVPGPAGADTETLRSKGGFAIAVWDDAQSGTFAVAELFEESDYLILILERPDRDANGTITGFTGFYADANLARYGSFTIDRTHLRRASLSVTNVPASECHFDVDRELIGDCTNGSIDAHVTWTGLGSITRSTFVDNQLDHFDGIVFFSHLTSTGPHREAGASGTMNGSQLSANDVTYASIAYSRTVRVHVSTCCR